MRAKGSKRPWGSIAVCACVSALLLLLCSMSSPLYPLNIWDDANCLLTVGRVMKEGGVLYRDIYEQKGPFLYLIHMLAAMIADSSFLGVYLMEVAFFAAALFFAQRLSRLWLSKSGSWAAAILFGTGVVVCRAFARGDSAEEFCLPFLMAALYIACSKAKRREGALELRQMLLLGVMAGFVAVIKFTGLGLFMGLCMAQGIWLLRERDVKRVLLSAAVFLLGMALPILPWMVYFAAHSALSDAYMAYIHNNIFLYNAAERSALDILREIALAGRDNLLWSLPAVLGVCRFSLSRKGHGFLRLCFLLAALMAGAAVFLPGTIYPYYPLALSVFAPLGFAALIGPAERKLSDGLIFIPLAAAYALMAAVIFSPNAFLRGVKVEDMAQGRLAAQMKPGATLLQYSHLDDGLYLLTGTLPQERFFVRLNVDYPAMDEALDEAVREGRPDYVLVSWRELPQEFDRYELVAYDTGYDDEGRLNKDMFLYRRTEDHGQNHW